MTFVSGRFSVYEHISIHIPRGGDDMRQLAVDSDGRISIHIPRGGDDKAEYQQVKIRYEFQSTSPVGGMTPMALASPVGTSISIHIPRGGDDP